MTKAFFLIKKTIRLVTEAKTKLLEFLARKPSRNKKVYLLALNFFYNVAQENITPYAKILGANFLLAVFYRQKKYLPLHSKALDKVMTLLYKSSNYQF